MLITTIVFVFVLDNQKPTVAAKPLEILIFCDIFKRLGENPRNFRSEHLRTSPTFTI